MPISTAADDYSTYQYEIVVTDGASSEGWIDYEYDLGWIEEVFLLTPFERYISEKDKVEDWILKMRGMDPIQSYREIQGRKLIKSNKTKYYSELHKIRQSNT